MSRSKKKPQDSGEGVCLEIYGSSEYCIVSHMLSKLGLVCYFLPCYGDAAVIQHAFTGDIVLGPQMPVRMLPYSVDAIAISDMRTLQQDTHGWCPRRFLKMAELRLEQEYGLRVRVGFETECILLKRVEQKNGVDHFVPLETSVYCQSWGFDRAADVVREICSALEQYGGQKVIHAHGESAHGQFEFITGHGNIVTQADGYLIRKEIIQHVANKHGLFATFLPKYFKDQAGSASHVHVSVERVSNDVGGVDFQGDNYGLSNDLARFMAGILNNLNALVLLTAGSPNSIRRMSPGCWAGAYTFWGYANKEAPLRMIDAQENHVEYKVFDGTANPYLGLCGLLCAGMDGLAHSRRYVTTHDGGQHALIPAPIQVNPDTLQTRDENMKRLPTSFEEAILSFSENLMQWNQSGMMHEWFKACCDNDDGGMYTTENLRLFFDDYKTVKFAESERFKGMSFEEEVKILFDKY